MSSISDYRPMLEALPTQAAQAFRDRPLAATLATIGGLWAASKAYDISTFTYLHFLRPSSFSRYQSQGPEASWALITGASDGIGKGFAEELCYRGFNVVLHGRNETKLNGVKDELLKQWPERKIKVLVLDAGKLGDASALEAKVADLGDIDLRVLVNNIGGGPSPSFVALHERSSSHTEDWININARFPTEITRCLLPRLTRNKSKPSLILNIGSGASEGAIPYLTVYSGAKAYNKSFSRCLRGEMIAEGHDVEVMCILVGPVATSANPGLSPSFSAPSARQMAKSSLGVVGCGKNDVWAYWPHYLQFASILALPEWMTNKLLTGMAKDMKAAEDGRRKEQ